jgi:hypothetical protein
VDGLPGRKARVFGQLEYWLEGDAYEGESRLVDEAVEDPFSPYFEGAKDVSTGFGGRMGVMVPAASGLAMGGSLGYIRGPKGEFKVTDGLVPPDDEAKWTLETTFLRLMFEMKKDIAISDKAALRLGFGLGFAKGSIDQEYREIGPGYSSTADSSSSWTGLSWEISPALAFNAGSNRVELGVMYAGFPKLNKKDNFEEFEWKPFGFRIAMEF